MSSLRVGAELLYLLTAEEAAGPIKTYSPELMVSSIYRHSHFYPTSGNASEIALSRETEKQRMVERVRRVLPKLHALAIGPGLGRDQFVLDAVSDIIREARLAHVPLIIDADGLVAVNFCVVTLFAEPDRQKSQLCYYRLYLVAQNPELVQGAQPQDGPVILTPNVRECANLARAVVGSADGSLSEVCLLAHSIRGISKITP